MCRLTAYLGPEIALERIIVTPSHSLLEQFQAATEAKLSTNGDGFGISWYGDDTTPGLYRDVLPAWSDGNLPNLCRMVKSHLFLAHVRASTVGEVTRVNCHPFTSKNWSFAHNGQIADFNRIRPALESTRHDDLYDQRRGTTDSEMLFLLCLANGLDHDPIAAVQATLTQIRSLQDSSQPNRLACVLTDGASVYGFRHSSDHASPTLYLSGPLASGGYSARVRTARRRRRQLDRPARKRTDLPHPAKRDPTHLALGPAPLISPAHDPACQNPLAACESLPPDVLQLRRPRLPLSTHLQRLRARGLRKARRSQRRLSGSAPHLPLPSMGRLWNRQRAGLGRFQKNLSD